MSGFLGPEDCQKILFLWMLEFLLSLSIYCKITVKGEKITFSLCFWFHVYSILVDISRIFRNLAKHCALYSAQSSFSLKARKKPRDHFISSAISFYLLISHFVCYWSQRLVKQHSLLLHLSKPKLINWNVREGGGEYMKDVRSALDITQYVFSHWKN